MIRLFTATVIDADGFLHTGDLGVIGDDGNLRIVGRLKEMYIRGGYNVYPTEVETVLSEHPAVARAAVIGTPDPVLGEIGVAFLVLNDGSEVDVEALRTWCRERLADYKAPDQRRGTDGSAAYTVSTTPSGSASPTSFVLHAAGHRHPDVLEVLAEDGCRSSRRRRRHPSPPSRHMNATCLGCWKIVYAKSVRPRIWPLT